MFFSCCLWIKEEFSNKMVNWLTKCLFDQYSVVLSPNVFVVWTINSCSLGGRDVILHDVWKVADTNLLQFTFPHGPTTQCWTVNSCSLGERDVILHAIWKVAGTNLLQFTFPHGPTTQRWTVNLNTIFHHWRSSWAIVIGECSNSKNQTPFGW